MLLPLCNDCLFVCLFVCLLSPPRNLETPHAAVRKLRFAPGKGNMKLFILYNSRLDIRDTSTVSQREGGRGEGRRGGMAGPPAL